MNPVFEVGILTKIKVRAKDEGEAKLKAEAFAHEVLKNNGLDPARVHATSIRFDV